MTATSSPSCPAWREIRRTQAALEGCGALVLPLHGDLPPAEQDRALRPAEGRRVVLATSIAETSLTVPGVRIVVDGGWRRAPRLDPSTGLTRLATVRISPRRGRAARRPGRDARRPGVAIRLWSTALHRGLAAYDRPEILEAELSSAWCWTAPPGARRPATLPFLDPPPPGALAAAAALLAELGALDAEGRITDAGPADGRAGRAPAARGDDAGGADARRGGARRRSRRAAGGTRSAARPRCARRYRPAAGGARRRRSGRRPRRAVAASGAWPASTARRLRIDAPSRTAIRAGCSPPPFPDRIAQRRGEPGSFRLSGGGGARLPRADPLANAPLLAVAALELKAAARIRLAAPLDPDTLPRRRAITEQVETSFDPVSGAVLARRRRRLGALVLADRTEPADPAEVAARTGPRRGGRWAAAAALDRRRHGSFRRVWR